MESELVTRLSRLAAVAAAALFLSFFGTALTCETASAAAPATGHGSAAAGIAAAPTGASTQEGAPVGSPGVLSGNVVQGG